MLSLAAHQRHHIWEACTSSLKHYGVRIELGVVTTLLVLLALIHVPFSSAPSFVGWRISDNANPFQFDLIDLPDAASSPVTQQHAGTPATQHAMLFEQDSTEEVAGRDEREADQAPDQATQRLQARSPILAASEQMPKVQGGLGSYYLNIHYPEPAIKAGVHGRLTLSFVVEQDGHPSQIEVLKSLHPLCDSAAVRALRRTRFVPGRQNGEPVRVRMRLPVHFKLIAPGADQRAEAAPPRSGR